MSDRSSSDKRTRNKDGFKKPGQVKISQQDEAGASDSDGGNFGEDMSLEARVALLEVENKTLKAENQELRKKLVAVLRQRPGAAAHTASERRRLVEREQPAEKQLSRRAAAERERSGRLRGQQSSSEEEEEQRRSPPRRQAPPKQLVEEVVEEEDPVMGPNAVMLANSAMEVYNDPITNNVAPEKRLPLVKAKLDRFLSNFQEKIQIIDLKSGKPIIKDMKLFIARYSCVFRESGTKLKGICNKRFFYDASEGMRNEATYVLDWEVHEHLVTAMPGTPQDGNLGVREPRTEYLIVLYEEKGGKVTRMWLRPDSEKVGIDPCAGEEIIARSEGFKAFEEKIKDLRGGSTGTRYFFNYHDTPTVG